MRFLFPVLILSAIPLLADNSVPVFRADPDGHRLVQSRQTRAARQWTSILLRRASGLTKDRYAAISGLQRSAAGDDTALFNALLLTVRDAAKIPGPKQIVVFSSGPDDASIVSPDDVARVAEREGIPISVISTHTKNELDGTY